MNIWHETPDAPRTPRRVSPTQIVDLTIGSWPIEPGQSVWVVGDAMHAGTRAGGTVVAQWQHNIDVNSCWPMCHPILPLLIDTDRASIDRPGTSLPIRFAHPEGAAAHITLAKEDYANRFGRSPAGMWPAEAAVSAEAVEMMRCARRCSGSQRMLAYWLGRDGGVI